MPKGGGVKRGHKRPIFFGQKLVPLLLKQALLLSTQLGEPVCPWHPVSTVWQHLEIPGQRLEDNPDMVSKSATCHCLQGYGLEGWGKCLSRSRGATGGFPDYPEKSLKLENTGLKSSIGCLLLLQFLLQGCNPFLQGSSGPGSRGALPSGRGRRLHLATTTGSLASSALWQGSRGLGLGSRGPLLLGGEFPFSPLRLAPSSSEELSTSCLFWPWTLAALGLTTQHSWMGWTPGLSCRTNLTDP